MAGRYREVILTWFRKHPEYEGSADTIYSQLKEEGSDINLATVYRNLDRLCEEREIARVRLPESDEMWYRYTPKDRDCEHHLHLICRKCGKIIHLDCDFMQEIENHLAAEHGFALDCEASVLTGLCRECAEAEHVH